MSVEATAKLQNALPECVPSRLLTPKQRAILRNDALGFSRDDSAANLQCSRGTLNVHRFNIAYIGLIRDSKGSIPGDEVDPFLTRNALIIDGINSGYIDFPVPENIDKIEPLSDTETSYLNGLANGLSVTDISKRLSLTERAAIQLKKDVYSKLKLGPDASLEAALALVTFLVRDGYFQGERTTEEWQKIIEEREYKLAHPPVKMEPEIPVEVIKVEKTKKNPSENSSPAVKKVEQKCMPKPTLPKHKKTVYQTEKGSRYKSQTSEITGWRKERMRRKEILEKNATTTAREGIHAHHWVIDTPNGTYSNGKCKGCGEEKEFRNSQPEEPIRTSSPIGKAVLFDRKKPFPNEL